MLLATFRVMPFVAITAIGGVAVAYFILRVPLNDVAVVVAVPLILLFAIAKILNLLMTDVSEKDREEAKKHPVPLTFLLFGLISYFSSVLAVDLSISAGIFKALGMSAAVAPTLRLAVGFLLVLLVGSLLVCLFVLRKLMIYYWMALLTELIHATDTFLLVPMKFSERVLVGIPNLRIRSS